MSSITDSPYDYGLEHLYAIAVACEKLELPHTIPQELLESASAEGTRKLAPSVFSAVRDIAQDIGFRNNRCYKDLSHLGALCHDSGLDEALLLVRGPLEALVIEVEDLQLQLPNLSTSAAMQMLFVRDSVREDERLTIDYDRSAARKLEDLCNSIRKKQEKLEKRRAAGKSDRSRMSRNLLERIKGLYASLDKLSFMERKRLESYQWSVNAWDHIKLQDRGSHSMEPLLIHSMVQAGAFKDCDIEVALNDHSSTCVLTLDFQRFSGTPKLSAHLLHLQEMDVWEDLLALKIPNIPDLYGKHAEDGKSILRVENFGAGDLRGFADQFEGSRLPDWILLPTALYLMETLARMHQHNYLHRDIKPENLLLRLKPDVGEGELQIDSIAVTDFGFSRTIRAGQEVVSCHCGTKEYVAPEIWDHALAGKPADIWSAGATLFCLRYGKHFQGADKTSDCIPHSLHRMGAFYARNCGKDAEDLDELDTIILLMLSRDPSLRPTAQVVLESLFGLALMTGVEFMDSDSE